MHITDQILIDATGCTAANAGLYAEHLDEACQRYEINTPERLAACLAQIGHESGSLRYAREIWGPTPAQKRYEGRADLGNTEPGDGIRYCGRGLIQTTGRWNYRRVTMRMRSRLGAAVPDFEADPEELERPRWAAMSAADYWDMHKLNDLADAGDFTAITRKINGGLNGQTDRLARWAKAKRALSVESVNTSPEHIKENAMPIPAIVAALLPSLIEQIPKLGKLFGSGSQVAERNVALATTALEIAQEAVGASNAQDTIERMQADPQARAAAVKAVEDRWYELQEAGGGGIDGARKADATVRASGDMLHSPSFWVTLALLPLVYMVVGSVVGLWGGEWPSDVRAAIATAVVSLVVGGAAGYYWGQTTSRNRTPANAD